MPTPSSHQITDLLQAWRDGDQTALEQLMPLVYTELHRLAKRYLGRERSGHTLQTTALIHEAYLRLIERSHTRWENRAHFFAISAQLMRQILGDFARSRGSRKRGGEGFQVSLGEALSVPVKRDADLVALDDALQALAAVDARKSLDGRSSTHALGLFGRDSRSSVCSTLLRRRAIRGPGQSSLR